MKTLEDAMRTAELTKDLTLGDLLEMPARIKALEEALREAEQFHCSSDPVGAAQLRKVARAALPGDGDA